MVQEIQAVVLAAEQAGGGNPNPSVVDLQQETMVCLYTELVTESIPGTILQMIAFLSTSMAQTGFQVRGALLRHDCPTTNTSTHLHTPGLQYLLLRVDDCLHVNDDRVRL